MIRVTVSYPSGDDATFDHDYYVATHVPLAVEAWNPVKCEIDRGVNGPNVAAVHFYFDALDDFNAAMASERTGDVMVDVANYTNIAPVLQVSEIVG